MSHIYHPDSQTHGLCDDCPECRWKAETGQGLDQRNMHRIVVAREHYTVTDQHAHATLLRLHPHLAKHGTDSPGLLPAPPWDGPAHPDPVIALEVDADKRDAEAANVAAGLPPSEDGDETMTVQHLRSIWRISWLVARRRLMHPELADLANPVENIVAVIEEVTDELFRRLGQEVPTGG